MSSCLIPRFDGAPLSLEWKEAIGDRFVTEAPGGAFRILDDLALIKIRVARLASGHAWAETPPSRTLRVVGSVLVTDSGVTGIVAVESALLLYRQRSHVLLGDVIPVRRSDRLRETDTGLKLVQRRAMITEAVLQTPNLGVFL